MTSSPPVAAVCQIMSTSDKEANFTSCKRMIERAKEGGASMIFLPEGFDYIGSSREETLRLSENLQGDIITRYSQLARCIGCAFVTKVCTEGNSGGLSLEFSESTSGLHAYILHRKVR